VASGVEGRVDVDEFGGCGGEGAEDGKILALDDAIRDSVRTSYT
jgi:hypothetical protein